MQTLELQARVESLEQRNQELQFALEEQAARATGSASEEVLASTPHLTSISIDRLSFARDTDGDGAADLITLYVVPIDGRARFVQMVGSLVATATIIPAQGEPQNVGRVELTPGQLRDAYRSGFTGTHYTIEMPIELPASLGDSSGVESVIVRVVHTQGVTGREFTADRSIKLQ